MNCCPICLVRTPQDARAGIGRATGSRRNNYRLLSLVFRGYGVVIVMLPNDKEQGACASRLSQDRESDERCFAERPGLKTGVSSAHWKMVHTAIFCCMCGVEHNRDTSGSDPAGPVGSSTY